MDVKTGDKVQFTGYKDTENVEVAALPGIVTVVATKPTADGESVVVVKDEAGAYLNVYENELQHLEALQNYTSVSTDMLPAEVEKLLIDKFTPDKFDQMLANKEVGDYLERLGKANTVTSMMIGGIFYYLTLKDEQGDRAYKTLVRDQTFNTMEEFVSEYLMKTLGFGRSTLWNNKAVFEACRKANISSNEIEGIKFTKLTEGLPLLKTITPETSEQLKREVLETLKNNTVGRIKDKAQELKNRSNFPDNFSESRTITLPTEGFATLKLTVPRPDYVEIIDSILPEARLAFQLDDTISDAYVITQIARQWQLHNSLQGDISLEHVIHTLEKAYGVQLQVM
jgi:hypothetical protein